MIGSQCRHDPSTERLEFIANQLRVCPCSISSAAAASGLGNITPRETNIGKLPIRDGGGRP